MASTSEQLQGVIMERAQSLVQKAGGLSQADAIRRVFRDDPALYEQYRRAKPTAPPVRPRSQPQPGGVEAEVMQKANALVQKASGLSQADAICRVFREEPGLYQRYLHKQDAGGGTAPTFGATLLTRQLDDFSEYTSALHATVAGILHSDAGDKGLQIATALDDFRATILQVLQQAGLSVPTQKRARAGLPERTEAAILKTALALAPQDPHGKGLQAIEAALAEIQAYAAERHAA